MSFLKMKQPLLLLVFLGLIATCMLAPIAAHDYLPESPDFAVHTAAIVQAKMALQTGQFPIRTAVWQDNGMGNAFFMYYSPLPYLFSGSLYLLFQHGVNPFSIMKVTMWLFILLSGIYFFKLTHWLFRSSSVALLTSLVYMLSPYLLININTRGDFTEVIAQGLVPVVLFYALKSFKEPTGFYRLCTILAWGALCLSHLVTYVYTSLFVGLFLLGLTLRDRSQWKQLIWSGILYGAGCVLALWYLLPIANTVNYLPVNQEIQTPMKAAWLTLLPNLLSITAVSPMPLPGNHELPMPLFAAVGWPILFAVFLLVYLVMQKKMVYINASKKTVAILLALFALAFVMTWSPFDFWHYLPRFLTIAQFSYRLLSQVMWIGCLLFGFALLEIFRGKVDYRHVALGIILLGLCASSWLPTNNSSEYTVTQIRNEPNLGYSQHAYLIDPLQLPNTVYVSHADLPFITGDHWLIFNKEVTLPAVLLQDSHANLNLVGVLPMTMFSSPVNLSIMIDGQVRAIRTIAPGAFELDLPLRQLVTTTQKPFRLAFALDKPFIPSEHSTSNDHRALGIVVRALHVNQLPPNLTAMNLHDVQPHCTQQSTETHCHLGITAETEIVPLPRFYYPHLMHVTVDGKNAAYFPIAYRDTTLTGVRLTPGIHDIHIRLQGIPWANWVSAIAWITLLFGFMVLAMKQWLRS